MRSPRIIFSLITVALTIMGCNPEPDAATRCAVRVDKDVAAYTEQVRTMELGFRSAGEDGLGNFTSVPNEALMVTGDQNILDVQAVVRYRVKDVEAFTSRVDDPEGCPDGRTLRDAALAALNETVGQRSRDVLLTPGDARLEVESSVRAKAQTLLGYYRTGIEVLSVELQSVSLPHQVCPTAQASTAHTVQLLSASGDARIPAAVDRVLSQNGPLIPARLLYIDMPPLLAFTSDKRSLILDAYVRYRIVDEAAFKQTLATTQTAVSRTTAIVTAELRAAVGAHTGRETIGAELVLNASGTGYTVHPVITEDGTPSREGIMRSVRLESDAKAKAASFGFEIVDVRLRSVSYPPAVRESIYTRMRAQPSITAFCLGGDA